MGNRQADECVEPQAEIRSCRLARGGAGQQLHGNPLLVAVRPVLHQFAQGIAARPVRGAGDQAEHEPGGIQLIPLLRRDRHQLPLEQSHGLALAAERLEHGGIGAGHAVTDLAALELFQVAPLDFGVGLRDRPEPQPRLLAGEDKPRP